MLGNLKHLRHQGPVIQALGRAAMATLRERLGRAPGSPTGVPGPELHAVVSPRDPALIEAFIRTCGGDPKAWRGVLPPHLFPQIAFPLLSRTLEGCGYPLVRAMNGGCAIRVRAPIPADQPIELRARLASVDDNGRRAILTQRLTMGTAAVPDALEAETRVFVPLPRPKGEARDEGPRADRPRVPDDARELASWRLTPTHGIDFALITGDINPIHWLPPAARAAGFRNTILHGFATLGRAVEGLNRAHFAGDAGRLRAIDVRFTRPLVLPARVGLFIGAADAGDPEGDAPATTPIWIGDAPGGPAYLVGHFETG